MALPACLQAQQRLLVAGLLIARAYHVCPSRPVIIHADSAHVTAYAHSMPGTLLLGSTPAPLGVALQLLFSGLQPS